MIDWATVIVPCEHQPSSLASGVVMTLDANGELERAYERPTLLRGSWESKTHVSSHNPDDPFLGFSVKGGDRAHDASRPIFSREPRHWIRIDGNPAKWRAGHNCWGTDDPGLIYWWITDVLGKLGLTLARDTIRRVRINRVDVTRSFRLDSNADVARWIRAAETHATMKYRGRGNIGKGQTLYWGQRSRRWAGKVYGKAKELSDHPIPTVVPDRDRVTAWADGVVRVEFRYMAMELKRLGIKYLRDLDEARLGELWGKAMDRINLNNRQSVSQAPDVSRAVLTTFYLWRDGIDPQTELPPSTWYRHRRELEGHGIDISIPCALGTDRPDLGRELVARPARVPAWATDPDFRLVA